VRGCIVDQVGHGLLSVTHCLLWLKLSSVLSDFRKILYVNAKSDDNHGQMTNISNFEHSKWRTTTILKIVILL